VGPENQIRRGEIYFVHLDPCFGREIGGYKSRPVVVVSIEAIHQKTRIVAVVPGTSTQSPFPIENVVPVDGTLANGLLPKGQTNAMTFFQCHQIRAVDQGRMTSRPAGRLSEKDFRRIETAVWTSLGWIPG
jgi:mRNA-degrading endonuclease toxin of MazEF toxin-antitoxin module